MRQAQHGGPRSVVAAVEMRTDATKRVPPNGCVRVEPFGPDTVRVKRWRGTQEPRDASFTVVAQPDATGWQTSQAGDRLWMRSASLSVSVTRAGQVSFLAANGRSLLWERPPGREAGHPVATRRSLPQEQCFQLDPPTALYGLGQYRGGAMNRRGRSVRMVQSNTEVVVPFLLSNRGWGLLWDNPSATWFSDDVRGMRFASEAGEAVDYYVCAGADADAVIRGYRHLTGPAPLMPLWVFGYWQSKERYQSAQELESVVAEYRRRGIPLDVIVQDWCYWGDWSRKDKWSGMFVDEEQFGDLRGAIRRIHRRGAKVMISVWPTVGPATAIYRELKKRGHMFRFPSWCGALLYDAFAPAARAIYWKHANKGLLQPLDVDAWWMDATEPEFAPAGSLDPLTNRAAGMAQRATAAGPWRNVLNAYGLVHTGGVHDGQRAATDRKRVVILTRSAFAGQQRNGAATWSGDIGAGWHVFAEQIPAGLNFCAAGIPFWTTDCGAFFVHDHGGRFPDGVQDPAYRELYLRWFQFATFCPIMRSHGTQTPREVWQFGQPGEPIHDALVEFIRLRTRLVPYLYSVAASSVTPMRALALDWPADRRTANIADQFLCGPALMVCPMTQPVAHVPSLPECIAYSDLLDVDNEPLAITARFAGKLTERANALDFAWRDQPVLRSLRGAIRAPGRATGLRLRTSGPVKLWLAGKLVLEAGDGEHVVRYRFATRVPVAFRLECRQRTGAGHLYVGWRGLADHTIAPERKVYLPRGDWYDFWTNERLEGHAQPWPPPSRRQHGRDEVRPSSGWVTRPAPLTSLPVLVRAGSILPLGPVRQFVGEKAADPIEVRVYPGADGAFTLYEDEGDGFGYERGRFATIRFEWNEARRELVIGARHGRFAGMLKRRTFRCRLAHRAGKGRTVTYNGAAQRVRFL